MTTFNRRQTLATMGAAAAVGLAAPAVAQGKKITLGALRFTSHSGTFVAYQREYFKQAGLDVELKFFQAAQQRRLSSSPSHPQQPPTMLINLIDHR